MNPSDKSTGLRGAGLGAAVVIALLAGCTTATQNPDEQTAAREVAASPAATIVFTPPVQDPSAPHLSPPSTGDTAAADGELCARMGEGHTMHIPGSAAPHTLPAEATDHLHQVFAASTDVSTATAYREDGGDKIFFCTSYTLRADLSGATSAVISVPATSTTATVAGAGLGSNPGENVVDYYGYASDEVAHVVITTPDEQQHLAAIEGHVWWAAPIVDEATASRSREGSWQALDRAGNVLVEGKTRPA